MRDDRRASFDPARGGNISGYALSAKRPAYKPSESDRNRDRERERDNAPAMTGTCNCMWSYLYLKF